MSERAALLSFPDPVDEVSARLVAGGVVLLTTGILLTGQAWVTLVLALGFAARVLTGPKLSPLGLFVTRVLRPRLPIAARPVPGPPKRFAQGMGLAFSSTAAVLALGFGRWTAAAVVLAMLLVAASLEAFVGLCLGCRIFAVLMRLGVIPEETCERCNDLWAGRTADVPAAR